MAEEDIPDCPVCKKGFIYCFDIWNDEDNGWMWECDACGAQFGEEPPVPTRGSTE